MTCEPYVQITSNLHKGTNHYYYLRPRFEPDYLVVALRAIMLTAVELSTTTRIEIKLVCDDCGTSKLLATEDVSRGIYTTITRYTVENGDVDKALESFINMHAGEIVSDVVDILRTGRQTEQRISKLLESVLSWIGRTPQSLDKAQHILE